MKKKSSGKFLKSVVLVGLFVPIMGTSALMVYGTESDQNLVDDSLHLVENDLEIGEPPLLEWDKNETIEAIEIVEQEQEKIERQADINDGSNKEDETNGLTLGNPKDEIDSPTMAAEIIASGTNGTSDWKIFEDGLLLIGAGTLAPTASRSPWSAERSTIKRIEFEPGATANTDASWLFGDLNNVTKIDFTNFDTSNTVNMVSMFNGMGSLTSLDVSGLDTINVTNMDFLFSGLYSVTELDLSGIDTSNVTNMRAMFQSMDSLTELDLSGIDTSSVMDMSTMFNGMGSLTKLDLSGIDTSNVTNMGGMFINMGSLTELDVSGFDTSNVTTMTSMFSSMSSITELDISGFDTSKVMGMTMMFSEMSSLTELDISGFDTSNMTSMPLMFTGTSNLSTLTLGSEFRFVGTNIGLSAITQSGFTGRWVGQNTETVFESSALFMAEFAGEADTYIWEKTKMLEVKVPVKTLFTSNQEDPTRIESTEYTLTNYSTDPVHVTISGITEERNLADLDLLQLNGISLIEQGESALVEEQLVATIPLDGRHYFSYTGQARQVTSEVNPSFNLILRFSLQ